MWVTKDTQVKMNTQVKEVSDFIGGTQDVDTNQFIEGIQVTEGMQALWLVSI